MKVFLTIWISAVLIQEVIPSSLARLPQKGNKTPSVVQTEYEAKYEQKGKHGNDSSGIVSGKQEIVHDNCAENWNSFAEKCASLIKDLVASLANAVSSQPGDATNLQLQIKNTFSHFDNTHNCTCLNHTGKGLSDLDLSPLFKNLSISTVNLVNQKECGDNEQNCKKTSPEGNDQEAEPNSGESDENESDSNPIKVEGLSLDKNCNGQNNDSQTATGNCTSGSGTTEVPQQQKQPNRALGDSGNLLMNPETADTSKEQLTNNSRRQVNHPKFSIKQPQTEYNSSSEPNTDNLRNSNSGNPNSQQTVIMTSPTPHLPELLKSPLVAPRPDPHSGNSMRHNMPKYNNAVTVSPINFSVNNNTPPSSDSQLLTSPNIHSTAKTPHPSTAKGNLGPGIIPIKTLPQKTYQSGGSTVPKVRNENLSPTTPLYYSPKKTSSQRNGASSNGKQYHYFSTTPFPWQPRPTAIVPVATQLKKETNEGFENGNHHRPTPFTSQPTVAVPVATQPTKEKNGGSGSENHHHHPSLATTPQPTVAVPVVTAQTTEECDDASGSETQHHSSSTTPQPTAIVPVATQTTECDDVSGSETQHNFSSTAPQPTVAVPVVATQTTEECDDVSGSETQHHSSSTTPQPTAIVPVATQTTECDDVSGSETQHNFSSTAPQPTVAVPVVATQTTEECDDVSGSETQHHSSSSTPQPTAIVPVATQTTECDDVSGSETQHHSSSTTPQSTVAVPVVATQTTEECDDVSGSETQHHSSSTTPQPTAIVPVAKQFTKENNGGFGSGNRHFSSSTPASAALVTVTPTVGDVQEIIKNTVEKPTSVSTNDPDSNSGNQQESFTFAPTTKCDVEESPMSGQPNLVNQPEKPNLVFPVTESPLISLTSQSAPVPLKPSSPSALIPNGQAQKKIEETEEPHYIKPTTFQTSSAEPTPSNAYLNPAENTFTTSLPTDSYKTIPMKPSTSPKTSEIHDDDDDEEDCCSCESCTEEEILDPKLYKENACKNLEEARRELKAIFDKIKKKLKCGRKAPQSITTN